MGRRTSEILERAEVVCIVVLIVATPTVFLRSTFSTFDVPQLTILWLSAMTLGLLTLARWVLLDRGPAVPRPVMVAAAVFLVSLSLNVGFSSQPWVAFTGLPVRGAGALTYGFCLLVCLSVYRLVTHRGPTVIVGAFVTAHVVVAGYALLQAYGGDPYQWGKGELWVSPVFSTLGNPNFSAAYLAVTLPLVTWLAFGSPYGRVPRVLGGALLGGTTVALSYLDSFQGDLAALVSLAVVANWACYRIRGSRLVATTVVVPAALAIVGVPLLIPQPGSAVLVALVGCLAVTGWMSLEWDLRHPPMVGPVTIRWTRRRVVLASSSTVVAMAGIILVAGGRIVDELGSGFGYRLGLWQTSLSIFMEHPIMGTGLETYSAYFTLHKPVSHVVEWGVALSDSPHSVPLGMLSGGGLLVAGAYVTLVGLVGWTGCRVVCRTGGSTRMMMVAIFTAWVAYQIQSLVSMDMPGLIATQWIFGGVLLANQVAIGAETDTPVADSSPSPYRTTKSRKPWWRWSCLCLAAVVWVVSLGPVTAPFRADLAAGRAHQALEVGDVQTGGERLLQAIELQPRRSLYANGMALVYSESDLYELAYGELARSAELQPGNPYAAVRAGQAAIRVGRVELASSWFERAVADGPNQAGILADAAAWFAGLGEVDRVYELLNAFEVVGSKDETKWGLVRNIYDALGEEERSLNAERCSIDAYDC